MNKPLTVTLYIGGQQIDNLTAEQCKRMARRLNDTMSLYYTNHFEEFKKIKTKEV